MQTEALGASGLKMGGLSQSSNLCSAATMVATSSGFGPAGDITSVKAIVAAPDHQATLLKEPGD
jgi:hypothetical protein